MLKTCVIGDNPVIKNPDLCNIYGCKIGRNCKIGAFVEIGPAKIGDKVTIGTGSFIPAGVEIHNNVFIGPHVVFCNDKYAPSKGAWQKENATVVESDVSIGAGAVILPSLRLGRGCRIGAGAVVTKDVVPGDVVVGNPAKSILNKKTEDPEDD